MKTVGEIKKYAESLPMLDGRALAGGLVRLKNGGVPFLGCVCFVQYNRKVGLLEARNILLAADVYSEREKSDIEAMLQAMLAEVNEKA
ncbi:Uncharacterised protein [Neisseria elongata]|jgi:hypothetical protein|uniref:Uncharacterized protein n=1 Tax=Neisseria elongata TaxID=495 RepID=A0A378TZH3_NEIEL|nr:hypothetical protein [Neisseria elongata]SFG94111.1 hypothetical protein SAMN05421815_10487 [Neisseria elongata subsp. elongata]STZ67323.1 Uncharacterised protein [Neisseria elongata]